MDAEELEEGVIDREKAMYLVTVAALQCFEP